MVNGKEVDGRLVENVEQNVVVSKLTVPQLRREHRNATYKCRAANTHLIPPLEKTVILDVYRECSYIVSSSVSPALIGISTYGRCAHYVITIARVYTTCVTGKFDITRSKDNPRVFA